MNEQQLNEIRERAFDFALESSQSVVRDFSEIGIDFKTIASVGFMGNSYNFSQSVRHMESIFVMFPLDSLPIKGNVYRTILTENVLNHQVVNIEGKDGVIGPHYGVYVPVAINGNYYDKQMIEFRLKAALIGLFYEIYSFVFPDDVEKMIGDRQESSAVDEVEPEIDKAELLAMLQSSIDEINKKLGAEYHISENHLEVEPLLVFDFFKGQPTVFTHQLAVRIYTKIAYFNKNELSEGIIRRTNESLNCAILTESENAPFISFSRIYNEKYTDTSRECLFCLEGLIPLTIQEGKLSLQGEQRNELIAVVLSCILNNNNICKTARRQLQKHLSIN